MNECSAYASAKIDTAASLFFLSYEAVLGRSSGDGGAAVAVVRAVVL